MISRSLKVNFLPPGPGLERLKDPLVSRALVDAVGRHTGPAPKVSVLPDGPENGTPERITEGTVKTGKLKELVDKEPALGEAVLDAGQGERGVNGQRDVLGFGGVDGIIQGDRILHDIQVVDDEVVPLD